ncbi:hypothetical protein NOM01_05825 [Sporolactobacillus sp. STSJ-5]|uniref:hypothetical protein n=1 Tax=Sporolactobacillus sp. STSJ-5 TaxID=2965076 RepID=UPI002105B79A|nr:hypothetical protein [Sporolactobacillus sp. STSJ-5]MCQ2009517.1 hypothetical protein [Sporolactobacillus sp. STSJ-5]
MTCEDAFQYLQTYGLKCKQAEVAQWLKEDGLITNQEELNEDVLERFNDWHRWKGTAYEADIDQPTQINRLIEENAKLRKEIEKLHTEIQVLEDQLGIQPF